MEKGKKLLVTEQAHSVRAMKCITMDVKVTCFSDWKRTCSVCVCVSGSEGGKSLSPQRATVT